MLIAVHQISHEVGQARTVGREGGVDLYGGIYKTKKTENTFKNGRKKRSWDQSNGWFINREQTRMY